MSNLADGIKASRPERLGRCSQSQLLTFFARRFGNAFLNFFSNGAFLSRQRFCFLSADTEGSEESDLGDFSDGDLALLLFCFPVFLRFRSYLDLSGSGEPE